MIVGCITILLFLMSIFSKKNKALYIVLFIWMWILMAFTTGIADEQEVYMSRYASPELWAGNSEILYNAIILLFRKAGCTFYQYKAIITFIQLLLIFTTVWKLSKYPNIVCCLYMIYPFPLNVAQMRHALATAIFVFAIRYLFEDDKILIKINKFKLSWSDFKYICLILIAACIHSASLIWLVLLVAKKFGLKTNIVFTVFFNFLIIFLLSHQNIMKILEVFGAGSRMGAYFSAEYQSSSWRHYGGALLNVTFTAALLIFLCFYILNKKSGYVNKSQVMLAMKANISILCIYGLIIKYTGEVYRLQESMTIMSLIILFNALKSDGFSKRKISKNNALVFMGVFVFTLGMEYISVGMHLIPTILKPILQNNILINSIF
ncbi:EpsG family protein [uncultured Gemmiger sp.]|uniref:EpsG family protein n=1 Tax=uncultured Gemmiger sp. TaxID=1623490 RepID=UPI0034A06D3E